VELADRARRSSAASLHKAIGLSTSRNKRHGNFITLTHVLLSFWGIFWIDGRSHRDLKRTLSEVAEFGGLDANVNAALTWLTNLDKSWLLIIDNADDPDVDLEDYIPGGDRGHVLITTRNVAHTSLGNIGIDFFTFDSLRHDEAETLLLVAAREEKPYSENVKEAANKISGALGHLALAITVAAGSIRNKWCSLYDYPDYYKRQTQTAWTRPKDMHPTETAGSVKSKYDARVSGRNLIDLLINSQI
jgi:hypothetical protein